MFYNAFHPVLLLVVCAGFLFGTAPVASAENQPLTLVTVNTPGDGFLALRSEPSAKTGVRLAKIPHGTQLSLGTCTPSSKGSNWCQASYNGFNGWVLDQYVRPVQAAHVPSLPTEDQRPVMIGGDPEFDACGMLGEVSGLNPAGDGFLALRSAPSGQAKLLHKLQEGDAVYICEEVPGWMGVVVYPSNPMINCDVSSPVMPRQPYRGECKSGWVSSKWIELMAD